MTVDEQTELLREVRDLLRVIAEPQIAKRDAALRLKLREIVGRSKPKTKAALLMDGSKSQAAICKEASIDQGGLSRMIKALRTGQLTAADEKHPKLLITIQPNFFEQSDIQNER
jgi:hypothetical protein